MHDAFAVTEDVTPDVSPIDFNWAAFRAACRQLGADTVPDCAALTGIPVRTLYKLRRQPESASIRNAHQIRTATSLGLDELFPSRCGEAA